MRWRGRERACPCPSARFRVSVDELWRSERGDRRRFEIECSSGTYVRSLIADLGDAICEELRRLRIGPFDVSEADPEQIVPLDSALGLFMPEVRLIGEAAPAPGVGWRCRGRLGAPATGWRCGGRLGAPGIGSRGSAVGLGSRGAGVAGVAGVSGRRGGGAASSGLVGRSRADRAGRADGGRATQADRRVPGISWRDRLFWSRLRCIEREGCAPDGSETTDICGCFTAIQSRAARRCPNARKSTAD